MDFTNNWQSQVRRLEPFNGQLIPVKENGYRADGPVKDHNYTVESILDFPKLRAIELRTSLELMCIDFDSEKAFLFAEKRGFNWAENLSWIIQRDNQFSRMKILFRRTPKQQKLGEFCLDDKEHDLEVFSKSTTPVTVLGHHRESGLYRWYGSGPEDIIDCPENVWNFILFLKKELEKKKTPKTKKRTSRDWRPIRPCPICTRRKDNDCSINREENLVQCHHGKTNHPPSLRAGDTLSLNGDSWAFCKEGDNAIGRFSLFKKEKERELTPSEELYGKR
mgnify:CR=1 FL=1